MAVVWSRSLTTDNNNWSGYCIRTKNVSLSGGGDQIRVRFVASGSQALAVAHVGVAKVGSATWPSTQLAPIELKFGGANGFSIAAGATITSDWLNFPFSSSDTIVVSIGFVVGTAGIKIDGGGSANDAAFKAGAASDALVASVSGYSNNGFVRLVDQIEGQFTTQTLTPSLFTDGDTFYAPTVTRGAVTLAPSLFSDADTFYSANVLGRSSLAPPYFVDGDSFFGPIASATNRLLPGLFTEGDSFYSPVVSATYGLAPALYSDPDTFYSPVAAPGTVTLAPALYTDADTFYGVTISSGAVTLQPGLYPDPDAFFGPNVSAGAVGLAPPLVVDPDGFYSASVAFVLSPPLFVDPDSFYGPVVAPGTVTLAPNLFADGDAFYSAFLTGGSRPPVIEEFSEADGKRWERNHEAQERRERDRRDHLGWAVDRAFGQVLGEPGTEQVPEITPVVERKVARLALQLLRTEGLGELQASFAELQRLARDFERQAEARNERARAFAKKRRAIALLLLAA